MSYRKKEKQTTQRIIASALHSFAQKGLPNVTLEEIALKIGMSNEVMFTYFESKEQLLENIVEQHLASLKLQLTPQRQTQTLYQLLSTLNERILIDKEETSFLPVYSKAFLPHIQSNKLKHEYKHFFNELYNFFLEEIEERIEFGELNEEIDTTTLASMLVSMLDGAVLNRGFFREESELLLKQKLTLFYYELLQWHFQMQNYHVREYIQHISKYKERFLNFIYGKIKEKPTLLSKG